MRALTMQVMVDDIEAEEEGIADIFLDTDTIAISARPGTSLKTANMNTTLGNVNHRLVLFFKLLNHEIHGIFISIIN